ncbi:MAG: hypothetical protein L0220_16430, partial [Acidobacteria bacterium]|nr:hypothetical protein [Acidobacteriota bacterium]
VCLMLAIFSGGCGGQLYKVAPLPASRPPEISTSNSNGLDIGAAALDGDQSLAQFEANLLMAGVIAVDLRVVNRSQETFDANKLRYELSDGRGRKLKQITSEKALSRVMKFYGNSFYTLEARRKTRADYESVAFKSTGTLAPQGERRGLLFYEINKKRDDPGNLTLLVTGTANPITLQLSAK